MDNLIIPASLRDAVVEYLANRPWKEVHQVMPHLINLAAAPVPPAETTTPETA
jgi:hypothetical protein